MKLKQVLLMTVCMLGLLFFTVYGEVCSEVLSTDITAYIDEQPIESFNINDYTYVIAEDLRGYGFDVIWDGEARTLSISRNRKAKRVLMPMEKVNIKKSEVPFRTHVFDVYETDIVTNIEGQTANAYNVDGQTLIMIDELSRFGFFRYDDATRCVKIDMAGFDEQNLVSEAERQSLSLPCKKIEGTLTFTGQVTDGKPDGYGVFSEDYEFTYGAQSTENYKTSGDFSGGTMNGYMYFHGKDTPHNGSDRRVRDYCVFSYQENKPIPDDHTMTMLSPGPTGYYLSITKTDGTVAVRREQIGDFHREITIDPEYRYGYRIDREGYVDRFGQFIDYTKTEAGRIVSVSVGRDTAYILDDKGDLYGFGTLGSDNTVVAPKEVPVLLDSNIGGIGGDATVFDAQGNMYYLWDKVYQYYGAQPPVIAENVVKMSDTFFLTRDGTLYRKPLDTQEHHYDPPTVQAEQVKDFASSYRRLLYQTLDGAVYCARVNPLADDNSRPIDGYDLSMPVKVFEDAAFISLTERYMVIDKAGGLWAWSAPYYRTGYKNPVDAPYTTLEPMKIAEDVIMAQGSGYFMAYTKTDGSLYVAPDWTESDNDMLFGLTKEEKLMEDVKEFSIRSHYLLAVKQDGTLWVWGKNSDGLGISGVTETQTPLQITEFYRLDGK